MTFSLPRRYGALILLMMAQLAAAQMPPATAPVTAAASATEPLRVRIETSLGRIVLQLDPAHAPITVANFVGYVRSSFYDGLIFERVIPGFMIQGGGFDAQFRAKWTRRPIKNESFNGLHNIRGSVAMARTQPDTAASAFFINLDNNPQLDPPGYDGYGYTVFGKVVSGMNVVDRIGALPTGKVGPFAKDAPKKTVLIRTMVLEPVAAPAPRRKP